ncbi:AAA family ATPase [Tuberibacillus sp. Marseille-P3662]|uniref:AAA family ATPase n=1 Tax=Tuberibacillus sp. Marseille-P3662 TaxID=1965358 RepID=UPI001C38DACE|nr:DUF3696 domain-containing protein [Tuberibacillus sp. Marseille-P3662]
MNKRRRRRQAVFDGIKEISVEGYKSIDKETDIEIKPLTVMAGTNSSGKSSFIQPLLLMKQTLEESFDPGALLLNGPNVRFTSNDQLLFKNPRANNLTYFSVGFKLGSDESCKVFFKKGKTGFIVDKVEYNVYNFSGQNDTIDSFTLHSKMKGEELFDFIPEYLIDIVNRLEDSDYDVIVKRNRCFLKGVITLGEDRFLTDFPINSFEREIRKIIHLPGLRGNPERNYPTTAVDSDYEELFLPGTFEKYVASIITQWQNNEEDKLSELENDLKSIGLTNRIKAKKINDTQVSLNVGRNIEGVNENDDLINIADVGLGVSQTLPVVVALIFAKPGQMVYIEQPEIHLHPRAQYFFAKLLAKASARGVIVVVETHSSILLRGIQTIAANNNLSHNKVKLHWFRKSSSDGATEVISSDLDENGTFGEWPVDFDDVELSAEAHYLDATTNSRNGGF